MVYPALLLCAVLIFVPSTPQDFGPFRNGRDPEPDATLPSESAACHDAPPLRIHSRNRAGPPPITSRGKSGRLCSELLLRVSRGLRFHK
jgi:hypothetical protein